MTRKFLTLTILSLVTTFRCALAQQLPDSTAYNTALAYYTSFSGDQSVIFDGNEYIDVRSHKGTVFFMDKTDWTMSTIVYEGNAYKNIPVLYDSFNDVVVALRRDSQTKYVLRPDKTTHFTIGGHSFTRVASTEFKNAGKDNYYEELYNGKSSVIAKRSKARSENITIQEGIKIIFDDVNVVYIKKNNIYNPVKSRGDVLKLFKDKADELNKYIKSAAVNFKENSEQAIVKLATYYDQLSL
ncbi:hypothetical protein ACFQZS_02800 [Mucilaginibacter calamicampi]|uniref:DUF4468 domain-containing protein n=1 Tax=Mucilaginibacter calamicampi TaxID=1302352 RepID=A0ABW2YRM6_9SPHI